MLSFLHIMCRGFYFALINVLIFLITFSQANSVVLELLFKITFSLMIDCNIFDSSLKFFSAVIEPFASFFIISYVAPTGVEII